MVRKAKRNRNDFPRSRINCVIKGQPAIWLAEWKRRGLVTSNTDAVIQAFRVFQRRIVEADLKEAQLRNLKRYSE